MFLLIPHCRVLCVYREEAVMNLAYPICTHSEQHTLTLLLDTAQEERFQTISRCIDLSSIFFQRGRNLGYERDCASCRSRRV